MDMAQGLGWNLRSGVTTTAEFNYSWFIGMIIGAVVSAVAVNWIPKKFIYVSERKRSVCIRIITRFFLSRCRYLAA